MRKPTEQEIQEFSEEYGDELYDMDHQPLIVKRKMQLFLYERELKQNTEQTIADEVIDFTEQL